MFREARVYHIISDHIRSYHLISYRRLGSRSLQTQHAQKTQQLILRYQRKFVPPSSFGLHWHNGLRTTSINTGNKWFFGLPGWEIGWKLAVNQQNRRMQRLRDCTLKQIWDPKMTEKNPLENKNAMNCGS